MSKKNGDKARAYRAQKKKILQRKRTRELQVKPAGVSPAIETAPAE
jgi:hypothetical protein